MGSKNNVYKFPLLLRIIPFSILLLLFIFAIICFFIGIFSIEPFFFAGILCIFNIFVYGIDLNVQYELSDNEIIIMMEIINKKKYNYSDIKEIKLYNNGIFEWCVIITNDNKHIRVNSKINGLMEYLNGIKGIKIINRQKCT